MNEKNKGFQPLYLLAILYITAAYVTPIAFYFCAGLSDEAEWYVVAVLFIPVILAIINLVIIKIKKTSLDRRVLLNCTVLIKYLMIPLYIVGGLLIVVLFLLMFTPVVIMMFVSPMLIATLCVMGWVLMIGAAPFSIAYIRKSREEGVHGKVLCIIATVLQFFFTADVISVMVLALKEKRHIASTVAMILLLILGFFASIIWLIVKIIT